MIGQQTSEADGDIMVVSCPTFHIQTQSGAPPHMATSHYASLLYVPSSSAGYAALFLSLHRACADMTITELPQTAIRALRSTQSIVGPVAVVKELIDNALDAGATSISIDVSPNPLDVIQVRDNGHGIPQADRQLVARRYCTSKIRNEDDLARLGGRSLGFRGEALSNMAELGEKLSVTTRTDGEMVGSALTFDKDGSLKEAAPISHAIGTTVRVEGLLYSQPVRRQTVAKARERILTDMSTLCQAYALARCGMRLAFSVMKSAKLSERWVYASRLTDNLRDIAMTVIGQKSVAQCELMELNSDDAGITALLPRPSDQDAAAGTGSGDFVAVDGRPLTCSRGLGKLLVKTVKKHSGLCKADGGGKLGPVCINLAFRSPPYDVNIEPAKDDIHFHDTDFVLRLIDSLLEKAYPRPDGIRSDQDKQRDETTISKADDDGDDYFDPIPVINRPGAICKVRDGTTDVYTNETETLLLSSEYAALNPWSLAKINSMMSPNKLASFSSPPKPLASVHNAGVGLWTPSNSPVRKWTAINAEQVSLEPNFESPSPSFHEHHAFQSTGKTGIEARTRSATDDSCFMGTPSLRSISPPPCQQQNGRRMPNRSAARTFNPNKPFKPPRPAKKDPEKDAWFDIPQMHKDEWARKRAKQQREGSVASPFRAVGSNSSRTEAQSSSTDIRTFMKPRNPVPSKVPRPAAEALASDAPPSFSGSVEDNDTGALLVDVGIEPRHAERTRPPLREIAPNAALGRDDTTPLTRMKSKSLQRSKSSMLPLERTPALSYTQALFTTVKSGSLLQEQCMLMRLDDAAFSTSESDQISSIPDLKDSFSELGLSKVIKGLRRALTVFTSGRIEFAKDFDHQIRNALIEEEEEMLI